MPIDLDALRFEMLVEMLREIRDAVVYLAGEARAAEEQAQPEPGCEHPDSTRTDFSSPREQHWVCGVCGFVYRSPGIGVKE